MDDIKLVSSLHEKPTFLPPYQIRHSVTQISLILFALFFLNGVVLLTVRSFQWCHGPKKTHKNIATDEHKLAYRVVSIIMNGLLGVTGIYHFLRLPEETTIAERITGFEELSILAYLQIAYQLWAIPMGVFFVPEPKEMLYHHIGVMVVGSLSAFFTNGFRYHDPFFFGLIESSSVPLVVMNMLRDSPKTATKHPVANALVGLSFALSFIVTRVFMWMPQAFDFIRLAAMMSYTCAGYLGKIGLVFSIVACFFLTALQLFWAGKIIRGVLAVVVASDGDSDGKKAKKVN